MSDPVKVAIKWRRARRDATGRAYLVLRLTWPDGSRQDRGIGYRTPAEAEQERARLVLGQPASASCSSGSVADVLAHYVADIEERHPDSRYAKNEAIHAERIGSHLGRIHVEALTTSKLRHYLGVRSQEPSKRGRPPSRATLFEELRCLCAAIRLSHDERRISVGPPALPGRKTLPDDARPARCLTPDEVQRLVGAAYAWDLRADGEILGAVVSVLAWQGRRPVAVWGLRYQDCSRLSEGLIFWQQDKGGESRGWSPVSSGARAALERLLERRPGIGARRLFLSTWDEPLTTEHFGRYWMHRLCEAADIEPATAYDLRRHACTRIVEACGGNLRAAMHYTGHRRVETLLRYLYASRDSALAAADRIGPARGELDG